MSAILFAKRVHCDWPGCQSEGEVAMNGGRELPAGWIDLRRNGNGIIRADGMHVGEVCSIHARFTVEQFAVMLDTKAEVRT